MSMFNLCREAVETSKHLFEDCTYMQPLYEKMRNSRPALRWPDIPTIEITTKKKAGHMKPHQKKGMLIIQFVIWRERCARSFVEECKDTEELLQEVLWHLKLYE